MTIATGSWLDTIDFSLVYPSDPLVPVAIYKRSPLWSAQTKDAMDIDLFFGEERCATSGMNGHHILGALESTEKTLLNSGPEAAQRLWREILGPPAKDDQDNAPITLRAYVYGGYNSYGSPGHSQGHWSVRAQIPTMLGISPLSAALYLSAIGRTDRPVPLSFARALLDPRFAFPMQLSDLSNLTAPKLVFLAGLHVDDQHRLVFGGHGERPSQFGSRPPSASVEGEVILSEGWRRCDTPLFSGYPVSELDTKIEACRGWAMDHDGSRLVRLDTCTPREVPNCSIPIAEISDVLPDVASLANDVRARPSEMLDPTVRNAHWAASRPNVSGVARRIIEAVLLEFKPWPSPFRMRKESERLLRPRESEEMVVALFDRLLDAPFNTQPTDLTAYFLSLITKRRAEFAAWPEELADVWGFKIKTGDHNWINGRIWHEPGQIDNSSAPIACSASAEIIQPHHFRNRYRHRVLITTGSLRCFIERDDT